MLAFPSSINHLMIRRAFSSFSCWVGREEEEEEEEEGDGWRRDGWGEEEEEEGCRRRRREEEEEASSLRERKAWMAQWRGVHLVEPSSQVVPGWVGGWVDC